LGSPSRTRHKSVRDGLSAANLLTKVVWKNAHQCLSAKLWHDEHGPGNDGRDADGEHRNGFDVRRGPARCVRMSDSTNPRGDGDACICEKCGDPFRRVAVLPAASEWEYCPTCMEEYLNR